jgi:hypothetical protein
MTENPRFTVVKGWAHDDVAGLVQHEVTLSCELGNCLVDLCFVHRSQVPDLLAARCVPVAGERVIDGAAHTLDNVVVHGSSTRWMVTTTVLWSSGSFDDSCVLRVVAWVPSGMGCVVRAERN